MGVKGPQQLRDLFRAVMPRDAEERAMGGSPAAMVNGNVFMRIRRDQFVLRLDDRHRAELLRLPGAAAFEAIPGRPMREYVVLPPSVLRDRGALARWVRASHDYAQRLAPQERSGIPQAQPRKQSAKTIQMPKFEGD